MVSVRLFDQLCVRDAMLRFDGGCIGLCGWAAFGVPGCSFGFSSMPHPT